MRRKIGSALLAAAVLSGGCELYKTGACNLVFEVSYENEICLEKTRNCIAANLAWDQYLSDHGADSFSLYYERGFKRGFADFLYLNGTGNPPPVPPPPYWRIKYQTPEGHQAIEDWYAGFRAGAAAARASGLHDLVVVPASVAAPGPLSVDAPAQALESRPEELPPPRPAPTAPTSGTESAPTPKK